MLYVDMEVNGVPLKVDATCIFLLIPFPLKFVSYLFFGLVVASPMSNRYFSSLSVLMRFISNFCFSALSQTYGTPLCKNKATLHRICRIVKDFKKLNWYFPHCKGILRLRLGRVKGIKCCRSIFNVTITAFIPWQHHHVVTAIATVTAFYTMGTTTKHTKEILGLDYNSLVFQIFVFDLHYVLSYMESPMKYLGVQISYGCMSR